MDHYQNQYGATAQSTNEYGNPVTSYTGSEPQSTDEYGNPVTTYTGSEAHRERGMMDKIKEKLPGTHDPYSSHSQTTYTTSPYGGTGYTGSEQLQSTNEYGNPVTTYTGSEPQFTDEYGNPVTTYTRSEPHRERGMMDRIKEKLPGTHDPYSSHSQTTYTTAPYGGTGYTGSEQLQSTNEYGNPVTTYTGSEPQFTDEYGNPVTTYTRSEPHRERGMMDRIKEKLPGTHDPYSSHSQTTYTTAPYGGTGYTESEQHHGMMHKITDPYSSHSHTTGTTTTPYGGTATSPYGGSTTSPYGVTTTYPREKKGIMDKIKDKLHQ